MSDIRHDIEILQQQLSVFQRMLLSTFATPDELLANLESNAGGDDPSLARARIPLRIEFLKAWPHHSDAEWQLSRLVSDLMMTRQHELALSLIDELSGQLVAPEWRFDKYRLRAAQRLDDIVRIATRISNSSAPPPERAWALIRLADAYGKNGERRRAIQLLNEVVAQFEPHSTAAIQVRIAKQRRDELTR